MAEMMTLVPFLSEWAEQGTPLDLHAIYLRPSAPNDHRLTLTSGLPVRRHSEWVSARKGFKYVCLASRSDLEKAAKSLHANGYNPADYAGCFMRDARGGFDVARYLREASVSHEAYVAHVQRQVDKFGMEAVLELRRSADPNWTMPEGIVPPTTVPALPKKSGKSDKA